MVRFAINKLIRDKIPTLIGDWQYRVLDDHEFKVELLKKLDEEVVELKSAAKAEDLVQELADVLEVLHSVADLNKIDWQEVVNVKEQKKSKTGGFNQRIFGIMADYEPDHPIVAKMRSDGRYIEINDA